MERRWTRPLLCRLCECPVADGGVQLSRIDRSKLSEWWLQHLDTEFDDEEPGNEWICQFCIWDARLEHESSDFSEGHEKYAWWTFEAEDSKYKYYCDDLIRPCSVKIPVLNEEEIFKCQKCQISFSSEKEKDTHDKIVHKKFKCIYCTESKVFGFLSGLHNHVQKNHQGEIIQCNYNKRCRLFCKTVEDRREHIVQVHQRDRRRETKCIYCDKNVPFGYLLIHVRRFHSAEAIKCNFHDVCPTYFLTIEERDKHISKDHGEKPEPKICIYCGKMVNKLTGHVHFHHKEEAIKCDYNQKCPNYFHSEKERREHVAQVHEKQTGNLKRCVFCKKMTGDLWHHVRFHHKSEAIKCNFNGRCGAFFLSQEEKLIHVSQIHKKNCVQCIYCKKMLPKTHSDHMKIFHKDVAIKCNFHAHCPAYFHTNEERDEHILKIHQTAKPAKKIKCIYCGKSFFGRASLVAHVARMHSEVRIRCTFYKCEQYFHTRADKEKHFQKIHAAVENAKKHKCRLCSYKTNLRGNFNLHLRKKHGTKKV